MQRLLFILVMFGLLVPTQPPVSDESASCERRYTVGCEDTQKLNPSCEGELEDLESVDAPVGGFAPFSLANDSLVLGHGVQCSSNTVDPIGCRPPPHGGYGWT
jgi:hypothetical protein